jgi:nucleobase:cation symporter-1, NCS1 family
MRPARIEVIRQQPFELPRSLAVYLHPVDSDQPDRLFIVRHGEYDVPSFFTPHGEYGGFVWRGLIPYALAVAVELPFISQTYYTGPLLGPLGGIDISWVVGGVAGVVFYLIAIRLPMRASEAGLRLGA